ACGNSILIMLPPVLPGTVRPVGSARRQWRPAWSWWPGERLGNPQPRVGVRAVPVQRHALDVPALRDDQAEVDQRTAVVRSSVGFAVREGFAVVFEHDGEGCLAGRESPDCVAPAPREPAEVRDVS